MASNAGSALESSSIGKDADCERVFRRFTFKCLQIILQSRLEKTALVGRSTSNDYFSINLPDCQLADEQIKNALDSIKNYPIRDRSICVEVALRTNDGDHMFLETWDLSFSLNSLDMSASKIQHIFTRMGLTLKSLLSATRVVPAFRLAKNQGDKGGGYKLNCRIYFGPPKIHMLGNDYKTVRAGALPSAFGLLSINVAYRTKMLLSPDAASTTSSMMHVTDDHFLTDLGCKESPSPPYSEPRPCYPFNKRRTSLSSPDQMAATPYHYSLSPSSQGTDEEILSKMSADNPAWPLTSILNIDELPEPAVGAFAAHRPSIFKVEEADLPFEGLMRRSMMAQMEQRQKQELQDKGGADSGFGRSNEMKKGGADEEEKENAGVTKKILRNVIVEEDFVMVDPPFACDEDPRDVKSFLGAMLRAPHLYDIPSVQVKVDDYLMDVGKMVSKLEEDMPVLDDFCQSVINFNSAEEEDIHMSS